MTVFFILTTIIFAVMLFFKHISVLTLTYYLHKKGYTLPTDEELDECSDFVIRHMFKKKLCKCL